MDNFILVKADQAILIGHIVLCNTINIKILSVFLSVYLFVCLVHMPLFKISVLLTTLSIQVPASSAPPKEAVYEEATKKLPVVQTELCLKKLSDYKTLSKVFFQIYCV